MQSYLGFVVIILVIGFIVFIAFQQTPISDLFSFQSATSTLATSTTSSEPTVTKSEEVSVPTSPQPKTSPPQEPLQSQITPPAGFTLDQISPYYQKVRASSIIRARSSTDTSRIKLTAYNVGDEPINISDWRIKTNSGELFIPQAINKYNPLSSKTVNNITLNSGDYLYLYSSKSPIGKNFRRNKCTGYLNDMYTFGRTLLKQCPRVNRENISAFSGDCQSFILSLRTCKEPTSNEINNFLGPRDEVCQEFLRTLNYRGCYNLYNQDDNFQSREWRAWLDKKLSLDTRHDRLLLFDKEGLLVNEYTY